MIQPIEIPQLFNFHCSRPVKMIAFNLSATDVAIKRIYIGKGLSSHSYDGEAEVYALRQSVDSDYVIVPESLL